MSVSVYVRVAAVALVAVVIVGSLALYEFFGTAAAKLSAAPKCEDDLGDAKIRKDPNRVIFTTCGGFL